MGAGSARVLRSFMNLTVASRYQIGIPGYKSGVFTRKSPYIGKKHLIIAPSKRSPANKLVTI